MEKRVGHLQNTWGYTDFNLSERAPKNETVSNKIIEHVVVKGDTAYAISKKYNILSMIWQNAITLMLRFLWNWDKNW